MSTGIAKKIVLLAAVIALGGCGTTGVEPSSYAAGEPILSAAGARAMISVEIEVLEPIEVDNAVAVRRLAETVAGTARPN